MEAWDNEIGLVAFIAKGNSIPCVSTLYNRIFEVQSGDGIDYLNQLLPTVLLSVDVMAALVLSLPGCCSIYGYDNHWRMGVI